MSYRVTETVSLHCDLYFSELTTAKGIAVFEDWLYWSDASAIYRTNKHGGGEPGERVADTTHARHLVPLHPLFQPRAPGPVCQRAPCSHLCVPVSSSDHQEHLQPKCLCPDSLTLAPGRGNVLLAKEYEHQTF